MATPIRIFGQMESQGHEQVVFVQDSDAGLTAIIGIHSTVLGPALGGTRMYPYASEEQALRDVMELSRGMTYKAAAAGLPLGGGKAVIIGDPLKTKSERLFRTFGEFVQRMNGVFYTGEDVGTDTGVQLHFCEFRSGERPRFIQDIFWNGQFSHIMK